jgi:hypothetical protein
MPPEDTTIPDGLCQCGCGGVTAIATHDWPPYGYVKGRHKRFCRGHNARIPVTRDWVDDDRGFTTPCHIWQRGKTTAGYGQSYRSGGRIPTLAHREAYEERYGPIPQGLQVDHLCRQRDCVNPDHLEAVTSQVNNQRMPSVKLTYDDVQEIRKLRGVMSGPKVGSLYGVGHGSIYHIWRGKGWQNVPGADQEIPPPAPRRKLTPDDVRQIREMQGTHTSYVLAEMFGVRHTTICDVWNRTTWQHVA